MVLLSGVVEYRLSHIEVKNTDPIELDSDGHCLAEMGIDSETTIESVTS
jgi:hypothetical protein